MQDARSKRGGWAPISMAHILIDKGARFIPFEHAARHDERFPGMSLSNVANMMLGWQQGRWRIWVIGMRHLNRASKIAQSFHCLFDIDAHIHVPHLVAIPSVRDPFP